MHKIQAAVSKENSSQHFQYNAAKLQCILKLCEMSKGVTVNSKQKLQLPAIHQYWCMYTSYFALLTMFTADIPTQFINGSEPIDMAANPSICRWTMHCNMKTGHSVLTIFNFYTPDFLHATVEWLSTYLPTSVLMAIFQVPGLASSPRLFPPFVLEDKVWDKWHRLILWVGCPSCHPTNSIKALKETWSTVPIQRPMNSRWKVHFSLYAHSLMPLPLRSDVWQSLLTSQLGDMNGWLWLCSLVDDPTIDHRLDGGLSRLHVACLADKAWANWPISRDDSNVGNMGCSLFTNHNKVK